MIKFQQANSSFFSITLITSLNKMLRSSHFFLKSNISELSLIIISSALLGIWATTHTIALRNILIGLGTLATFFYWLNWSQSLKKENSKKYQIPLISLIPLAIIFAMFAWVIIHLIFFAVDLQRQFDEFASTWIRSILATLIGITTGVVLTRQLSRLVLLWLGLLSSFIVLMWQYFPKMMQSGSLFAIDYFGSYIYWAKFNGVLAGTVLIAGLLGLLIDRFRDLNHHLADDEIFGYKISTADYVTIGYCLLGIFLAFYSFVFIFNAKNGVGLSFILVIFWSLIALLLLILRILRQYSPKQFLTSYTKLGILFVVIATLIGLLGYKHVKTNPGWESLLEDIKISSQIDLYPNWRNPSEYGYPKRSDGSPVAGNTYERVSWATAGLRIIRTSPFGNGMFRSLPDQLKKLEPNFSSAVYTHSAWIDFGLAYGWLGIFLIPSALIFIFSRAIMNPSWTHRATIITLSLALLILYGVGEYAFQQGVEILFYLCGLLSGLSLVPRESKLIKP